MLLDRFFKPKWLHRNPEVRKKALQELNLHSQEAASIFAQVAENDQEPDVRRIAIKRMTDLSVLARLLKSESEPQILEIAHTRLAQLMSGQAESDLQQRLALVDLLKDENYEFVLKNAKEIELRLAILALTKREGLLGDIAIHDTDPQVRRSALQRISRKSTLERVYRQTRSKDKQLSNEAKQRLDEMNFKEQRPNELKKQARHLCGSLEKLLQTGDWEWAQRRYQEVVQEWQDILTQWQKDFGDWDDEIQSRYQTAEKTFIDAQEAYLQREQERRAEEQKRDPIKAQKRQIVERLQNELKTLQDLDEPEAQQLETSKELMSNVQQEWNGLENLGSDEKEIYANFKTALGNLQRRCEDIDRYLSAKKELIRLDQQLSDLAGHESVQEKKLLSCTKRWRALEKPIHYSLDKERINKIEKRLADLNDGLQKQKEKSTEFLKSFSSRLDDLDNLFSGGKIADAKKLIKKMNTVIGNLLKEDLQKLERSGDLKRFRQFNKNVEELHKWKAWANTPVKERLVAEAEDLSSKLADSLEQFDLNEVAQIINEKRQEWRTLGASENKNAQELWDRFNVACNDAYGYCKNYFEEQSHQRKVNKEAKEQICKQLEDFVETADWGSMNWGKVEKIISTAKQEWSNCGIVDRKYNKALNNRFTDILEVIKSHLSGVREDNRVKKEQLIKKMQDITEELMVSKEQERIIRDIVNQVKSLQKDWQRIGKAAKEHELWKKFRGCCDSVFSIRDELNSAKNQEKDQNYIEKVSICEAIESIVNSADHEFAENKGRLEQLRSKWKEIGQIPADKMTDLNNRFDTALSDFSKRLQDFYVAEELRLIESLSDVANQRDRLWDALRDDAEFTTPMADLRAKIDERFSQSDKNIQNQLIQQVDGFEQMLKQDDWKGQLQEIEKKTLEYKLELCLKMEIFADLESPDEYKEDRMKLQVSQLESHLKGDGNAVQDKDQARGEIIEWFLSGSVAPEYRDALEQRFQRVYQAVISH